MNERIRELIKQADIEFDVSSDHYGIDTAVVIPYDLEKFAELIVRECLVTIENAENGYQDYRNQIEDAMRNHCIWLIKDKFGVEK